MTCKWPKLRWWRRGATAWEAQIGYLQFRYIHLVGGNWRIPRWCPLGRFRIGWLEDDK